ncbi:hypothetical protein OCH239_01100 [Roseivivax halodurans JCM 10272]|uniref:DUF6456 domain-containing protein n=1 Tax=Roseivivax halodurans JCM 10272 TaxID=1449350 RepID=X7EKS1_9RHOB|nr:DUF6456 domain-containing protein [Roseivivax halodurans]ETX16465.1 hypothetical protein OCH239_01100 [Roseivivax halodurans JCM 10272]
MLTIRSTATGRILPDWVPPEAKRYLEHTESGTSMRALARASGCHASTVMRQVRKIEVRREDPLVDAALRQLGAVGGRAEGHTMQEGAGVTMCKGDSGETLDDATLRREAEKVLRMLCWPGTILAVARDMDKAVVVSGDATGAAGRKLVVDAPVAQAMALKEWIACGEPGRVSRYAITAAGRTALREMTQVGDATAAGFAEAPIRFEPRERIVPPPDRRAYVAETPVLALARRRDKAGEPFLTAAQYQASERLREDFEIASLAPGGEPDVSAMTRGTWAVGSVRGRPGEAADRMALALAELGPGLGDMAIRCCCRLEGLETAERSLGWSARSGKIVLRIALDRLARHYASEKGQLRGLIG